MALIRATALKDFRVNPLTTTDVSTGYQVGQVGAGQKLYGGFHLTQASTGRPLVMSVQGATASGFGSPTTIFNFALSSARGSTWGSCSTGGLASTELKWWRLSWSLSTAASTAGSWNGIGYIGIR
jgi:hypothetical protein